MFVALFRATKTKIPYKKAIEEVITINELKVWMSELDDSAIDDIIRDIDMFYRLEMQMDADDEE